MKRRKFLELSSLTALSLSFMPSLLFSEEQKKKFFFKISLAQWSLHRTLQSGKMTTLDFPVMARTKFGLDAVEYVNQFFADKANDNSYLSDLKRRCADNHVKSLLIMIDGEGHLSATSESERTKAVENHKKWIDAASFLGCHSIRVNLHGDGTETEWKAASIDGLGKLAELGKQNKINVIVENHGQWSSKGSLVAEVIKQINNPYCGTLPDFGNFCVRRRDGDLWESPCVERYDAYQGVDEMMPYAKGVSAKSFDFDSNGNDTTTDYTKMLSIVKKHGYSGYLGIEYEGQNPNEEEGILKTIALLKRVGGELSR